MLRIGRGRIEVLDVDAVAHLARWVRPAPTDASGAHRVGTVSLCADGFLPS